VLASAALLGMAIYLTPLHEPSGTEARGLAEFGVVAALALVPTVIVEAAKAFRHSRPSRWTKRFGASTRIA
jgi:hypothetical protein